MSFWGLFGKKKDAARATGGREAARQQLGQPFEYEAKLVYVPPRASVRVWKTRSVSADEGAIYLAAPEDEWESSLPREAPVTVYLLDGGQVAEFDSVLEVVLQPSRVLLKAKRPEQLDWHSKEGAAQARQQRKFLRVDVSLPAQCALVVPTMAGRALQMSEPSRSRLIDLSIEGASVLTELRAEVGQLVELKVLSHSFPLAIQARVVRLGPPPPGTRAEFSHALGLVFQTPPAVTRDMIAQFILEKQRER